VKYLPLLLVLLAACAAPPTAMQVTSRAVNRNCEAQGTSAAAEVRKQSAQAMREGNTTDPASQASIEAKARKAEEDTYRSCMLKYAV
jgi:uncharacterized lipoprotein YajG